VASLTISINVRFDLWVVMEWDGMQWHGMEVERS